MIKNKSNHDNNYFLLTTPPTQERKFLYQAESPRKLKLNYVP